MKENSKVKIQNSKLGVRLFAFVILHFALAVAVSAQTTTFTYQGKLTDASITANGPYDFTFKLYDAIGTQVGSDVLVDDVNVAVGIFTVNLDFGAAAFTNGAARFI